MKGPKLSSKQKRNLVKVFFIILLFYAFNLLPSEVFLPLIEEDGLFENLTAVFFLLTSIGFLLLFFKPELLRKSRRRKRFTTKTRRYAFLLLSLVFFFGFGEEISWGQRIFGFATPELMENNAQDEFNIHNLEIFNFKDNEGNERGNLAKLFTMKQLFLYSFGLYLLLIPLLRKNSEAIKKLITRFYIPVPPVWLGLLFVGNYLLYRVFRAFIDDPTVDGVINNGLTEMQEFNFSVILLLVPIFLMRLKKKPLKKAFNLSS